MAVHAPPQTSSHLERGLDAHLLQRIEFGQQLRVLGVVSQALRDNRHGAGVVALAAQHTHPLAPSHGLSGVALQGDQLLKSCAGGRPVLPHLRDQGADDQDVFALGKALHGFVRQ